MNHKIYQLVDPIHQITFYVGQSSQTLDVRLKGHLLEKNLTIKSCWVRELYRVYKTSPVISEVEDIETNHEWIDEKTHQKRSLADVREAFWILRLISNGHPLMNESFPLCRDWGVSRDCAKRAARKSILAYCISIGDMFSAKLAIRRWSGKGEENLFREYFDKKDAWLAVQEGWTELHAESIVKNRASS